MTFQFKGGDQHSPKGGGRGELVRKRRRTEDAHTQKKKNERMDCRQLGKGIGIGSSGRETSKAKGEALRRKNVVAFNRWGAGQRSLHIRHSITVITTSAPVP